MKFRVCFTLPKYENDMVSLCEKTNVFIDVFFFVIPKSIFISKVHVKLIKTMMKSLNVCKVYLQRGIVIRRVVTKHELHSVQLSRMMNLNIEFARNKCLFTIWSTEINPIA